jgi:hypothetical protein
MILIAFSLSLIAIVSGTFLLAKTKSEALGSFFKFISWFVIIMGFLSLICLGIRCMKHSCHREGKCGKEMRMGEGRHCMEGKEGSEEMERTHCDHGRMEKQCPMMNHENGKHCFKDSSSTK